jgi:hypothetical protein
MPQVVAQDAKYCKLLRVSLNRTKKDTQLQEMLLIPAFKGFFVLPNFTSS